MFVFALLIAAQANVVVEPDHVEYKKVTALIFTDADVDGDRTTPTYSLLKGHPKGHRKNLIELRSSFRPELKQSRDKL